MIVATHMEVINTAAMKKGTKLTDNPKDYMLRVRMDSETLDKLDTLCTEAKKSRSEVVRECIHEKCRNKK